MVVFRRMTTFSNFQAIDKKETGRETSGPQRKKKKVGEMDDETCMKGLRFYYTCHKQPKNS